MELAKPTAIYVTKLNFQKQCFAELKEEGDIHGNLIFSDKLVSKLCFAQDVWLDPYVKTFASISEAAKLLRQAGKFWFLNPLENVRRSQLIVEQLRTLPPLMRDFPVSEALAPIGCFSLLDKNTLVYSFKRWKAWPLGECHFIEDKTNPPNRAYLKLWEALSLMKAYPKAGETALDLGASPGGWTYVMHTLGVKVTAVDKAELDPKISSLSGVTFLKQSAFALDPDDLETPVDWLLGDIACYPERLFKLILRWIESKRAKQMILTIKLQGETDLEILRKFQELPHSRTLQLFHNKHEVTFFYPSSAALEFTAETLDSD